jgi:beta-1,4-mannosyl-glycoprotein beta-1,4-N-acetylglucosaminyltransferase
MVFDCIPFFNELDILKLRLEILDPYVDKFILEEATVTFSGKKKEMLFDKNRELFKKYLDRIVYVPVTDTPDVSSHERDYFQKNRLMEGLKAAGAGDEDVIIFGDVDEIPNPVELKKIIDNFDPDKVYHLAQRNFYAFLNMEEKSGNILSITGDFPEFKGENRKWLGTKVTSLRNIPREGIVRLRDLVSVCDKRSVRIAEGGWHFGYMGGYHETNPIKRIGDKIKAAAHQEYNDREILAETMDRLILGQDIFGRNGRFERVDIDDSYPDYIRDHLKEYDYLVMPPITAFSRFTHSFDITVGRFCRKAYHRILRIMRHGN